MSEPGFAKKCNLQRMLGRHSQNGHNHTDFTSQYPTVNALLGNWDVLTCNSIGFVDYTATAKSLLSSVTLEKSFDKEIWKKLSFFALLKPDDEVLPVRTMYAGKRQTLG